MSKALWLLAVLGVLALVVGLAGCGGMTEATGTGVGTAAKPPPTPPPSTPSKIAFSRDSVVSTMNTDGTGVTALRPRGAPEWSADGSMIAYVATGAVPGTSLTTSCIFVMDSSGQNVRQLTQPVACKTDEGLDSWSWDSYPTWSPDGSEIAFGRGNYNSGEPTTLQIVTVPPPPALPVVRELLAPGTMVWWPAWSPDGNWIVFDRWAVGQTDLWVVHPDGTGAQLVRPKARWADWSPVAPGVVVYTDMGTGSGIRTAQFDAAAVTLTPILQLTTGGAGDGTSSWSPDGTEVVFSRAVSGSVRDLFRVRADGTGLANITNTRRTNEGAPDWSPAVF